MSLLHRIRPSSVTKRSIAASVAGTHPAHPSQTPQVGVVMAILTGLWIAAWSWLAVVLPTLLAWATSGQSDATWGQSVRVATDIWLALHRVGLRVPGGLVALAPLAGLALPVGLAFAAGRRIGAGLDKRAVSAAGSPVRALAPAVAGLSLAYGVCLTLAALLARGGGVRPILWQALIAGLVLPAAGALTGALRGYDVPVAASLADALRLPARLRRTIRPAARAVATVIACGAMLLLVSFVVHFAQVASLYRALDAGVVGGAVLTLGQLSLVPNLAMWGVAFIGGSGFAVGVGSSVTPGGVDLGLLPLMPVLGALPTPGALPMPMMALTMLPVVVGAALGWSLARTGAQDRLRASCADVLMAVTLATGLLVVLLALSGGSAGPGRLAAVGPSPWQAGLTLGAELVAGALPAAWAAHRSR